MKHINDFANECGYFNPDVDVNNGYGCDHPDQEEKENGQGKCFAKTCPLSYFVDVQYVIPRERDSTDE